MAGSDPHSGPLPPAGEGDADSLSRARERVGVRAKALRASSTDSERKLWNRLRNRTLGWTFRRQHPIGPFVADFACVEAGLVVEIDGGEHLEPDARASDARRALFFRLQGFETLRFSSRDALTDTDGVLASILEWIEQRHPHPTQGNP
jgi:very-short-patch-repair endonuclease